MSGLSEIIDWLDGNLEDFEFYEDMTSYDLYAQVADRFAEDGRSDLASIFGAEDETSFISHLTDIIESRENL